jgi:hypothetical protein
MVQRVRREADLDPPCMAYGQTFRRAGFHEAASLSDADRSASLACNLFCGVVTPR